MKCFRSIASACIFSRWIFECFPTTEGTEEEQNILKREFSIVASVASTSSLFTPRMTRLLYKDRTFYRTKGEFLSISSGDPKHHDRLRRQLAHGSRERAFREQEPLVGSYTVALLIKTLTRALCGLRSRRPRHWTSNNKEAAHEDTVKWPTSDVIGDLLFGESFGSLERAKDDPWVEPFNGSIEYLGIIDGVEYMGLERL